MENFVLRNILNVQILNNKIVLLIGYDFFSKNKAQIWLIFARFIKKRLKKKIIVNNF